MNRVALFLLTVVTCFLISPETFAQPPARPDALEKHDVVGPAYLPDSTALYDWKYPNGFAIATRHIAGAGAVAITLGFPVGSDDDPAGRRGLANLVGEILFSAPAGDVPARRRADMESIRPLGWSIKVNPATTQISEIATLAQLPGVLTQMAARLRDLRVTEDALKAARAVVKRDLGESYLGAPDQALYWQVRAYALGDDEKALLSRASGADLDAVTLAEVTERLRTRYAPGVAVLAIAGDLSTVDLDVLLERAFGGLPAGNAVRSPGPAAPRASVVERMRKDMPYAGGVVGIIAPSLADSLHPSFYLASLALAGQANRIWGAPTPPLTSRFQYSLLDDPTLVRLYPKLEQDSTGASALSNEVGWVVRETHRMAPSVAESDPVRRGVLWILGGPLPPEVLAAMRRDPAALNTLSNMIAAREIWGGERFWSEYRRRFDPRVSPGFGAWARYMSEPRNQAVISVTPPR